MGAVAELLTVDLGNSRLKACRWSGARLVARHSAEGDDLAGFEAWLAAHGPTRVGLSSVASEARTARVLAQLAPHAEGQVRVPVPLVTNLCRSPERVGRDRLHAAAGALGLLGRSCVVVDAGTALTVDALRVSGAMGSFLGGAIAPGPALLARALATGTARLPEVAPRPGARALGRVTEEAIEAGIVIGFRGAAERLVEELARAAELAEAPVVLTGGASAFLLEPTSFTTRVLHHEPELLQLGLRAALEADGARS